MSRDILEQQARALAELEERRRRHPLYYYEPHEQLRSFHHSPAAIRMIVAGNRTGKSHALVAEAGSAALGFRPWVLRKLGIRPTDKPWERPDNCPDDAAVKDTTGVRLPVPNRVCILTGLPAKRGIGEVIHTKVQDLLGPYIHKVYHAHAGVADRVVLKNGSQLLYSSAHQSELGGEGSSHHFYATDEPIPKRLYTAMRRGSVDHAAPMIFSMTPIGKNAIWAFTDLYSKADNKKIATWSLSIYDNKYLPRAAVEAFVKDPVLSAVEKIARVQGKWTHLVDTLYPQFTDGVHIIDDLQPPAGAPIICALDPHIVKHWALAWAFIAPNGDLMWFREWPDTDYTKLRRCNKAVGEYNTLIREIEGRDPATIRVIDPNAGVQRLRVRDQELPPLVQELARYGLHFNHHIRDDLEYGEQMVRGMLAYDRAQPLSSTNRPRMYFARSCTNLINAMKFYSAGDGKDMETIDETKRDPQFKDFADVCRYAVVSGAADYALHDSFAFGGVSSSLEELGGYGYGES